MVLHYRKAIYDRPAADGTHTGFMQKETGRLAWLLWRSAYFTMTLSWRNKLVSFSTSQNFELTVFQDFDSNLLVCYDFYRLPCDMTDQPWSPMTRFLNCKSNISYSIPCHCDQLFTDVNRDFRAWYHSILSRHSITYSYRPATEHHISQDSR